MPQPLHGSFSLSWYVRQCRSAPNDGQKMCHLSFVNHCDSREVYHLAFQSDPPRRVRESLTRLLLDYSSDESDTSSLLSPQLASINDSSDATVEWVWHAPGRRSNNEWYTFTLANISWLIPSQRRYTEGTAR